jgi:hypothetical protein
MKFSKERLHKILKEEVSKFIINEGKLEIYQYLHKSPRLKSTIIDLFSSQFIHFIKDIYVSAPIPTTFVVTLVNEAKIQLIYADKVFVAKVSGKKFRLDNASNLSRCREYLSTLLTLGHSTVAKNEEVDTDSATGLGDMSGGGGNIVTSGADATDVPATSDTSVFQPIDSGEDVPPEEEPETPLKESIKNSLKKKIISEIKSLVKKPLNEYSQSVLNKLFEKFKTENVNLTDEQIQYYIDRFIAVQKSPKVIEKDILKYSFKDLEKLVDDFPSKEVKKNGNNTVSFSETELVYNKPPLQIFHGDSPKTCIKIRGDFSASWCIARTAGNMYHNYRFAGNEPSFYFVKNQERLNKIKNLKDDPYCFFVIQIYKNGNYIITNSLNDGDKEMSWNDILKLEPLLNGTQGIFKQVELTPKEKADYNRFKNGISDEDYKDLSYDDKKIYISITNELNDDNFKNTPKQLINDFITTGVELTKIQYEFIEDDKQLNDNYRRVTINNVVPLFIKGEVEMGSRWLALTDEEAYKIYLKNPSSLRYILEYKPNSIKYFKDFLSELYSKDIRDILIHQPILIEYFKDRLSELNYYNISNILVKQPSLINYFKDRLSEINSYNISNILEKQPTLIEYFKDRLSELDSHDISNILSEQPSLINYFKDRLSELKSNSFKSMIRYQPTLIKYFKDRLLELQPSYVVDILYYQPSLIEYFKDRLSEFNSVEIKDILYSQPQLAKYFDKRLDENFTSIHECDCEEKNLKDEDLKESFKNSLKKKLFLKLKVL